jgi:2-polyprenyl-6-methoxyphenol hydroxylase-like FAD-dependent oxidoreductase
LVVCNSPAIQKIGISMQFHLNGFRTGDPGLFDSARSVDDVHNPAQLPAEADVLIVGCGPAGLTLAAQLSAFAQIRTVIVDQKPGPLQLGQADGIACRTMEMFEAFGFVERVLKESYWVNETCFWKPDESGKHIVRSGRVPDVEEGLSHMPHVILNQARVHDFYLDVMQRSPSKLAPHYGRRLVSLERAAEGNSDFPVSAQFELQETEGGNVAGGVQTIRAKYVVGCDGARSKVRTAIGRSLKGDSANHAWGVMDVLVETDFPDIRFKSLVQSATEGVLLIIPREGGYLVRVYVELDKLAENERVAARNITLEQLIAAAQRIFQPYRFEVKEVPWWSVYEIGQRLCDKFDDVAPDQTATKLPRIFIAGDACHTHSPKAGQGMNVSMQDGFNIGWKLVSVLTGKSPASLLHTYSAERQAVAQELIDFDREWATMLSAPLRKPGDPESIGLDPTDVQRYFVQHGRYTAGTATTYKPALLTGAATFQQLAAGFKVGTRFHSAPVIRIGDGKELQLGTVLAADARWRLIAFAGLGDDGSVATPIGKLCHYLVDSAKSPIKRFTPAGGDIDSVIDFRAVFQKSHHELAVTVMPELLFPHKGKLGLRDYEKAFNAIAKEGKDIYAMRGIDREQGCLVLVRPDQYIAQILPFGATVELEEFFSGFMLSPSV